MHRYFRVSVLTHERRCLRAYGPITQRRTFSATRNDPYVFCHSHTLRAFGSSRLAAARSVVLYLNTNRNDR